jgi:hypothetical protein
MLQQSFVIEPMLNIEVPNPATNWEAYDERELSEVAFYWERTRETIFARIQAFEEALQDKQTELDRCDEFQLSCQLVQEISELSEKLLKLNQWLYWNDADNIFFTSQG